MCTNTSGFLTSPGISGHLLRPTDHSLTPRQRGRRLALDSVASKQPRLPSDALKLIVRPRGGLLLSKITNFILFEAVCTAANFAKASVRGEDLIQVNPKQNTFAYCTPAVERAERVLRLRNCELGHRADVCASTVIKCRGCAIPDPPSDHVCVPTCRLCGKQHITGDSRCKEIYRTPYITKRRQWEALQREEESKQQDQATQRRVTLKRSSRWDRQWSVSTQSKHRDRSASFPPLGADSSHKSSRPSSSSRAPTSATTQPGPPAGKPHGSTVSGTPSAAAPVSTQGGTTNATLEKAITHLTAVVTQLVHRVTTIEKRIGSGAFSHPPSMTETPTSAPMETDSLAGTAPKRKAYEVGGTQHNRATLRTKLSALRQL
ncbi:hypothetical protein MTO96_036522 [Rhipicephalus appendiculatus]